MSIKQFGKLTSTQLFNDTSPAKDNRAVVIVYNMVSVTDVAPIGNSLDKLRHPRSDASSVEQVLLNKQQIWCGGAYPDCYTPVDSQQ